MHVVSDPIYFELWLLQDCLWLSQPSMSRVLMQVIDAIIRLVPQYVYIPQIQHQWTDLKMSFQQQAHFPNVLEAIDCTHVALRPPRHSDVSVCTCNQYHSLNVQLVCDTREHICMDGHVIMPSSFISSFPKLCGRTDAFWLAYW